LTYIELQCRTLLRMNLSKDLVWTRLIPINGRTLSGVTRRADARLEPDVDRRVTFDRAVWTKPLAVAADAVPSAMAFQSWGP
jgi:hypothetical protein